MQGTKVRVVGGEVWCTKRGRPGEAALLVLHGGPGVPHDYLLTLRALETDREVVFYDQLGCGRSGPITKKHCTLARFVEEVEHVRAALDLERVDLLGHSWGGLLAAEYALRHPHRVRRLILASPLLSVPQWVVDMRALHASMQGKLPKSEVPRKLQKKFLPQRNKRHYTRAAKGASELVYKVLWGTQELACTGALRGHDRSPDLKAIAAPTLLTCGTFDGCPPATATAWAARMQRAQAEVFEGAGHYAHLDFPERYVARCRAFLSSDQPAAL